MAIMASASNLFWFWIEDAIMTTAMRIDREGLTAFAQKRKPHFKGA